MLDAAIAAEALALLSMARVVVRRFGVHRGITLMARFASHPGSRWLALGDPQRVVTITCAVSARARASCVERAIALWTLLRLLRRPADLCIGFGLADDTRRLGGHAWVELDGAVLDDSAAHVRGFQVVSRNGERVKGA